MEMEALHCPSATGSAAREGREDTDGRVGQQQLPPFQLNASLSKQCFDRAAELKIGSEIAWTAYKQSSGYANSSLLGPAQRVRDLRLRFNIWMSDCDISEDPTSAINLPEDDPIHILLISRFKDLRKELDAVLDDIAQIVEAGRLMKENASVNLTGKVDLLDAKISISCDKLESILRNLTDLEEPLQMAQAVNHKAGPFAGLEEHTAAVKSLYGKNGGLPLDAEESPVVSDDDASYNSIGGECSKCGQRFPNHVLPYHSEFCSGQAPTTSKPPEVPLQSPQGTQPLHETTRNPSLPPTPAATPQTRMQSYLPGTSLQKPKPPLRSDERQSNEPEIKLPKVPDFPINEKGVPPVGSTARIFPRLVGRALRHGSGNINEKQVARNDREGVLSDSQGEEYTQWILNHSTWVANDTLHSGENYRGFAEFLVSRPSQSGPTGAVRRPWATLYVYPKEGLGRNAHQIELENSQELANRLQRRENESNAYLLFLNGHQYPSSIATTGGILKIDPEFFRSHIGVGYEGSYMSFDLPLIPSSRENIIKLRITTILFSQRSDNSTRLSEVSVRPPESFRHWYQRDAPEGTEIRRLTTRFPGRPGFYTVEQDISITVESIHPGSESWIALIWSDVGHRSTGGLGSDKEALPTFQYRRKGEPQSFNLPEVELISPPGIPRTSQSARLLPELYGRSLHCQLMAQDAFYALNDLFFFAANSEAQFLNMMKEILQRSEDPEQARSSLLAPGSRIQKHAHIPTDDLIIFKDLLEDHIEQIRETIDVIVRRGCDRWPKVTPGPDGEWNDNLSKANDAAKSLQQDFLYLLARAEKLLHHVEKRIDVPFNKAMSDSLLGTERFMIKRLELETYRRQGIPDYLILGSSIIVPAFFVSSFFGMNFIEIYDLSLWVWGASAVPLTFLSIAAAWFWILKRRLLERRERTNILEKGRMF